MVSTVKLPPKPGPVVRHVDTTAQTNDGVVPSLSLFIQSLESSFDPTCEPGCRLVTLLGFSRRELKRGRQQGWQRGTIHTHLSSHGTRKRRGGSATDSHLRACERQETRFGASPI